MRGFCLGLDWGTIVHVVHLGDAAKGYYYMWCWQCTGLFDILVRWHGALEGVSMALAREYRYADRVKSGVEDRELPGGMSGDGG